MPQALIVQGTSVLMEVPTSPMWERGDTTRATQVFRSASYALARASLPPKGAYGTGDFAGMFIVSATVSKERGQVGVLTLVYEGPGLVLDEVVLPPDECEIDFAKDQQSIKELPLFSDLTDEDRWAIDVWVNSADFRTHEFFQYMESGANAALMGQLRERLLRGQEHKLIFPPVYRWTSYYLDEPYADGGGYIDFPNGPLTAPSNYMYLRAGDQLSFNGTFYRVSRTWIGAPMWDGVIYT